MAGELHDDIREGRITSTFVLRVWAKTNPVGSYGRTCSQIADEIEQLRQRVAELELTVEGEGS